MSNETECGKPTLNQQTAKADGPPCNREVGHPGWCRFSVPETEARGSRWCPVCRKRSRVADESLESEHERHREVEFSVTHLVCGHSIGRPNGITHDYSMHRP